MPPAHTSEGSGADGHPAGPGASAPAPSLPSPNAQGPPLLAMPMPSHCDLDCREGGAGSVYLSHCFGVCCLDPAFQS